MFFVSKMVGPVRTDSSSEETKKRVRLAVDWPLSQELDMLMSMAPSELSVLNPCSGSVEAVLSAGLSKYSTSTVARVSAGKREVSHVTVAGISRKPDLTAERTSYPRCLHRL